MADIEKKDIEQNETLNAAAPAESAAEKAKAVKSDKKDAKAKKSKPSIPSRMAAWFRSCKSEMKKIVWASPKTVLNNSVMVIVSIVVVAVVIALLDYLFSAGIIGLNKLI